MQSHDPQNPATPLLSDDPSHGKHPDDISRGEHDEVSISFTPETGRRTKTGVGIAAAFFLVCFVVVIVVRYFHAHAVAQAGEAAYLTPPPVDVGIARPA